MHGKARTHRIHRLVATAFIPNPLRLNQINHKDEIKTNNNVENLEWCDVKYNINYGTRNQKVSGENSCRAKLSKEDVMYIRRHYKPRHKEYGAVALARKFNVYHGNIGKIVRREIWKSID